MEYHIDWYLSSVASHGKKDSALCDIPAQHHHGFRKKHSAVNAPHRVTCQINIGLNKKKLYNTSILVAMDLTTVGPTYVEIWNANSDELVRQGIHSLALFNIYLRRMPAPPSDATLTSYSDDCLTPAKGPYENMKWNGWTQWLLLSKCQLPLCSPTGMLKLTKWHNDRKQPSTFQKVRSYV